jgi:hypothetical protein
MVHPYQTANCTKSTNRDGSFVQFVEFVVQSAPPEWM